jgi:hypothetical protein
MTNPKDSVRRAAKSATAPVRNYVNNHFEMVKQEIRGQTEDGGWQRVAALVNELEATIAETSLHEARILARLRDESTVLQQRLAELERVVGRLADVVAASTLPDSDPEA